jgi:UDP-N-acetylglucosamine 2-epimerase (non-hydrolysing)
MTRVRVLAVAGTRPEAIKIAPVVRRLRAEPDRFDTLFCATGQHREMLDQVILLFGVQPDVDLDLMRPNQSPSELASRVLASFDALLARDPPDWVLVQGDTTTALGAALAAFHRRVRIGHVEAGLRTGDLEAPFPEEMNRQVVDVFATALFAPTQRAVKELEREGRQRSAIHLTGNTVVDALQEIGAQEGPVVTEKMVLVTAHRRESFGPALDRVVGAIARLARLFPDIRFVHIEHPNPNVRDVVRRNANLPNVDVIPPTDYRSLVRLLRRCRLVLTDSGGIQEEAPTFGKPVLVMREKTERPEGVEAGIARLVGTDGEVIVREVSRLLRDPEAYRAMSRCMNPYGDGHASDRIVRILLGEKYEPFRPPSAREGGP